MVELDNTKLCTQEVALLRDANAKASRSNQLTAMRIHLILPRFHDYHNR